MRLPSTAVSFGLVAFAGNAVAFPASVFERNVADGHIASPDFGPLRRRQGGHSPGFDAKKQYISNTGVHKYVAPGPTDMRGPCPGLNALANHNYLPHNGVATIQQFIDATTSVFGMGEDLAGFLSIYGAIFDGDLFSWSIGGPTTLVNPLGVLLGTPQGISGSHNKYECDVSPTRGDLYVTGDDYKVIVDLFKGLYEYQADKSNEESNYDLNVLEAYRVKRFQQSISGNPYFFNGPFSGFQVQPAAFTFIYRFMANKSAEYPEGRLSQEVLKSFFAIEGTYPNFKWVPGGERIPDYWYRRAYGDEYTIPFFEYDLIGEAIRHPQFLDIGGNTGKVNSFAGLDITNLTGGLYNLQHLTDGHNATCFSYQLLVQAAPDILEGLFTTTTKAMSMLNNAVSKVTAGFGCPELSDIQEGQFKQAFAKYPGYSQLKKDGTY